MFGEKISKTDAGVPSFQVTTNMGSFGGAA